MPQYNQNKHRHKHHNNRTKDSGKKFPVKPVVITIVVLLSIAIIVWGVLFLTRDLRKPVQSTDAPVDITDLPDDDLSDL